MTDRTHALYRFYDATGQLLYVGITLDPGNRWRSHAQDKPWWHEVRGISMETYDTRDQVLAAERRTIAVEHPLYNKQRPPLHPNVQAPNLRALVWICDTCRGPIADGDGYLHVNHAEVRDTRQAEREWRERNEQPNGPGGLVLTPATAWIDYPAPARWQAHHEACDPDPDAWDYHFDVSRARTHAQLLHWTAHLMGKRWMVSTDWLNLIDRMSGVDA